MDKVIIFIVVIVIVGTLVSVLWRRRAVLRSPAQGLPMQKKGAAENSQQGQPQQPPEPVPAGPEVAIAPPPTSHDGRSPATIEDAFDENAASVREYEEGQATSDSQLFVTTNENDGVALSDTSQPEAHGKDTITSPSSPEAAAGTVSTITPPSSSKSESGAHETSESALTEAEPTYEAPTYHPPIPPTARPRTTNTRAAPRSASRAITDLRLRVQVAFGRNGAVKTLALVPDRREGMAGEIEVGGTQGEMRLVELSNDCYESVPLADAASALRQGVEWRGRGEARRWRWVLSGRELYVLASGDVSGLYPFGSVPRLCLNARHVLLATVPLREKVMAALMDAGCATPQVNQENTSGVPFGWLLFRDVIPTRAVPMREDGDILNVLCPAHEVEPHFVGGIRLERNIWLAGFPPRIRFTGELGNSVQVLIDGQTAELATDGAFEAPGWDAEGEHRLWFGDRAETYSLRTMDESWDGWPAHDFGIGAAICGAGLNRTDGARWHQVRVPATNPLLVGARPGEVFCCDVRHDVRSETILAMVPFVPVWALPFDSAHADKRSARILLFHSVEPVADMRMTTGNRAASRALAAWSSAIRDAGCKGLAVDDEEAKALWRRYDDVAKRVRKRIR